MSTKRMTSLEVEALRAEDDNLGGESFYLSDVDPSTVDLMEIASVKSFLNLVMKHDLVVRVRVTRVFVTPTYYAAASKANSPKSYAKGDVKKPSQEMQCIFITATNLDDFAVQAVWEGTTFKSATIGGPRSGHYPEKMFKQSTKTMKEITRCLA
jgi:hypothetical protein